MVKASIAIGWNNVRAVTIKIKKNINDLIASISWNPPDIELNGNTVFYELNVDNYRDISVTTTNTKINLGHNNIKLKIRTVYEIRNNDNELLGIAKSDWSNIFLIKGVRDKYCENIIKCKNILLNNSKNNTKVNNSNISSKKRYAESVKGKGNAISYNGNYNRCGFSLGNIFR